MKSILFVCVMMLSQVVQAKTAETVLAKNGSESLISTCQKVEKRKCVSFLVVHKRGSDQVVTKEVITRKGMLEMLNDIKYTVFNSLDHQVLNLLSMPLLGTAGVLCISLGCNDSGENNYGALLFLPLGIAFDVAKLPVTITVGTGYLAYIGLKTRHFISMRSKVLRGKASKQSIKVKNANDWELITFRLADHIYL